MNLDAEFSFVFHPSSFRVSLSFSTFDAIQAARRFIAGGRGEEARKVLEPLVGAAPGYAAAHVLLAEACEQVGDSDAAREAWDRAVQLVPRSALVRRKRERLARHARKQESRVTYGSDPAKESGGAGWAILDEEEYVSQRASSIDVETIAPGKGEEGHVPVQEIEGVPVEESPPVQENGDSGETSTESADALTGELDDLITRLESASRIRPDPAFEGPDVEFATEAPPSMASETLADVYASQGQYEKAAETYERLAEQKPDRAEDLKKRAAEMRSKA